MASLVHAALTMRKTVRASFGLLVCFVFALVPLLGVFRTSSPGPVAIGVEHVVVGLAWAAWLVWRGSQRLRRDEQAVSGVTHRERLALELELGVLLIAGVHAIVQATGGIEGPVYAMVYVLVAFIAAFAAAPIGAILVLVAIAYEALVWLTTERSVSIERLAIHGVFIAFFGVLNLVFTRVEIARVRERSRKERDEERARVEADVRLFRLVGAPSVESTEGSGDKVVRSSVDEVRDSLFHVLDLLKKTLDLHTCILLFAGEDKRLRIIEMATDSDDVDEGPFEVGAGAVGAVATRGVVMNLENLKSGYRGLCYYREGTSQARSFLGVPVVEQGQLRGALCADRLDGRPFTAREEEILKSAVGQVLRGIQNERVFVQLERSKREQGQLFKASRELGAALTEDEVLDAGLSAAAALARFDFAAVTFFDAEKRLHSVRTARGTGADVVRGTSFKDNHSLAAMVVKNKHYLPYKGELDPKQVLFTAKTPLPAMRSALVIPLIVREGAMGTLVVGAERASAFGDSVRSALQVLGNQLAIALSNARAVKRLEEMATTDGLTGCLNKRAFLEELEAKIRSAQRFQKKVSLIVTDIDFFKSVNDTYGHATGDVVIKELGAILMRVKRETDRVARFGGEEFCVLCEETDTEGATLLAERVREELGKTVFQTELGKLRVAASLGVATFPEDASSSAGLFEITDKALYAAKHSGRDRVCTAKDV
ncbi:MAG: diguanylate cyclase [Deltaproteobacteria bacterium]|nr:diguanylate cyclase [Deltaproteobacteria bacterium]